MQAPPTASQKLERAMLTLTGEAPPALPDLPDFDTLLKTAQARLEHFSQIANAALVEASKAQEYIDRLTNKPPAKGKSRARGRVSNDTYLAILSELAKHNYAGVSTLTSVGASDSTVYYAMRMAVEDGHVERQVRGHKYRWTLTERGMDLLTAPDRLPKRVRDGQG